MVAYTLTVTERAIIVLVAHGLSNEQIARELGLGVSNTSNHLAAVAKRWGIRGPSTRGGVVGLAYRSGAIYAPGAVPPPVEILPASSDEALEDEMVMVARLNGWVAQNHPEFEGDKRRSIRDRRGAPCKRRPR